MTAFLETFWHDVLYSLRTMRKSPAFAVTAVLTLAIGIGGNTAIFTVIHAVLLKPLGHRDPGRLGYFSVDQPRRNLQESAFTLAQFNESTPAAQAITATDADGRPSHVALYGSG